MTPKQVHELKQQIINWLAEGKLLSDFVTERAERGVHEPSLATINLHWPMSDPEFAYACRVARWAGLNMVSEEMLRIADGRKPDENGESTVPRDRLRVDARRTLIEKLAPMAHNPADVANPATTVPLNPAEREAKLRELVERVRQRILPASLDEVLRAL